MHIIFDTLEPAEALIAQINVLLGYPKPNILQATGQPDGTYTTTWTTAEPLNDGRYAVLYRPEIDPVLGDYVPVEVPEHLWPGYIDFPE